MRSALARNVTGEPSSQTTRRLLQRLPGVRPPAPSSNATGYTKISAKAATASDRVGGEATGTGDREHDQQRDEGQALQQRVDEQRHEARADPGQRELERDALGSRDAERLLHACAHASQLRAQLRARRAILRSHAARHRASLRLGGGRHGVGVLRGRGRAPIAAWPRTFGAWPADFPRESGAAAGATPSSMHPDAFAAARGPAWDDLAGLIAAARGRARRLPASDILRLGSRYRETAADLAYARRRFGDDPVTRRLETLVLRARPLVYATPGRRGSLARLPGARLLACDRRAAEAADRGLAADAPPGAAGRPVGARRPVRCGRPRAGRTTAASPTRTTRA